MEALSLFEGPLAHRVYLSLKRAILRLAFRPGEALRKQDLCAAFGVSRSPVSDALTRLAGEGLVRIVPQAGSYVARFSMAEIREGAFLREALELAAVAHLAPCISDDQIARLNRSLVVQQALVNSGDRDGFYEQDAAMHAMMMGFTGFRRLGTLAETAWLQVDRARRLVLPAPGRVEATLEEHRAIVAALAARDSEAARAALRSHLRQLVTYLEPLETAMPELFDSESG
ncbi:MAG: GntR family transcriptional regulator [Mangrovicoccus sp.]|nr:GntR family transcriptional regulator [Mangrovicoccus sp.]